jgi:hypothetical protein
MTYSLARSFTSNVLALPERFEHRAELGDGHVGRVRRRTSDVDDAVLARDERMIPEHQQEKPSILESINVLGHASDLLDDPSVILA